MEINETNPIKNILPYIPHFEEADQTEKYHHKRKFLAKSTEAVTNCNLDTSNILIENDHDDPP